jgi:hypothetical protein
MMEVQPFLYGEGQIAALEAAMSAERFDAYVRRASGDRAMAVKLYERNTALSEALFGVVQAVEVSLRNALHTTLAKAFTKEWYGHPELPYLDHPLPEMLESAIVALGATRKGRTARTNRGRTLLRVPDGNVQQEIRKDFVGPPCPQGISTGHETVIYRREIGTYSTPS